MSLIWVIDILFQVGDYKILEFFYNFRNFGLDILIRIDEGRYGDSATLMRT
tara:strand:+ start:307 stop:459 length:153 start_codon:yes stop_codon:yes gene_type:complete